MRASYAERPRQDLARLDSFEILWSPLTDAVDYVRTAALQLVVEVLDEAMPDGAPEDAVFRLALTVLTEMRAGRVWLPVTYFCLWMNRLMGWMPELGHCAGLRAGFAGQRGVVVCGGRWCDVLRRPATGKPGGECGVGCGELCDVSDAAGGTGRE